MNDPYIGKSGDYVFDNVTGERLLKEDYEARQLERATAVLNTQPTPIADEVVNLESSAPQKTSIKGVNNAGSI